MQLLKKNKSSIKVPTGWHQITIGQYEEALEHLKGVKENHVIAWSGAIAACMGKQPIDILKQKVWQINEQQKSLMWLNNTCDAPFVNEFDIAGNTFTVNPDIRTISADAFIFMTKILAEPDQRQKAKLCALFVWKKGENFNAEKYNDIADLLYDKAPCSVLIPLYNFFFALSTSCVPIIKEHLGTKLKNQFKEIEQQMKETMSEI